LSRSTADRSGPYAGPRGSRRSHRAERGRRSEVVRSCLSSTEAHVSSIAIRGRARRQMIFLLRRFDRSAIEGTWRAAIDPPFREARERTWYGSAAMQQRKDVRQPLSRAIVILAATLIAACAGSGTMTGEISTPAGPPQRVTLSYTSDRTGERGYLSIT